MIQTTQSYGLRQKPKSLFIARLSIFIRSIRRTCLPIVAPPTKPEFCVKRIHDPPLVLLIESDPVAALDLIDAFAAAGYGVLGPAGTMAEALRLLHEHEPTLAVIDLALNDGCCTALTHALRQRSIPYLVHSACSQDRRLTGDVQGVPWLVKPAMPEDVVALCDEMSLADPDAPTADRPMPSAGSTRRSSCW